MLLDTNPLDRLAEPDLDNPHLDIHFQVGINQIELGDHGSQDYQFLPGTHRLERRFNTIAATVQGPLFTAQARTSERAGVSSTTFHSVSGDQEQFFPAHQYLDLFMEMDFTFADEAPTSLSKVTVFNKYPMRFRTARPLTGFPPLYGPDFELLNGVELFDVERPDVAPLIRIERNTISPFARILYQVHTQVVSVSDDGSFTGVASISLLDNERPVPTAVHLLPTRGVSLTVPEEQIIIIQPNESTTVQISGQINDKSETHISVTVRPYSIDPEKPGAGRSELDLDFVSERTDAALLAEMAELPGPTVRPGERFTLHAMPLRARDSARDTGEEYIWIPPDGVSMERANGLSASFVAPEVPYLTDAWATLYVRSAQGLSRPHKVEFRIDPALATAPSPAQPGLISRPGQASQAASLTPGISRLDLEAFTEATFRAVIRAVDARAQGQAQRLAQSSFPGTIIFGILWQPTQEQ